jgi:paraquat-inducible protein A
MSGVDSAAVTAAPAPQMVECHDCGLRYRIGELPPRAVARCRRCGAVLRTHSSLELCLALAVSGLVLVLLANLMPFMSLEMEGRIQDASLASGALVLAGEGLWPLTALILLTTVVAPALKLGGIAYVVVALWLRRAPPRLIAVLRWLDELRPWSMIEVYLLGMIVAYVKLTALATIVLGPAVFALAALMVVMAWINAVTDFDDLWAAVDRLHGAHPPAPAPGTRLACCGTCGLLTPWRGPGHDCPRCGARLHPRKPDSIARCWALVIAAAVLYIPANVYPILTVISFGSGAPDTILSGAKHLVEAGMWPLALLVFFASITVPVLKICGLVVLLVTTQARSRWRLHDRTVLFRVIESVGRWSMIDIFMLSILVALVRLGQIASITPGLGALSFGAVVVLTMFAASSFDPRLMWDEAGENS